jgi:hypothetical protein
MNMGGGRASRRRWVKILPFFDGLAPSSADGVPRLALLLQLGIVTALIVTSTFEKVLVYIQLA